MIEIRNYTKEDLEFIKQNFNNMTVKQLAKTLNKTDNSITNVLRKMGLKKQIHNSWTDEHNLYLINNYMNYTAEEIAKTLNRTVASVNSQIDRLKLVKCPTWTIEEINYLKNNFMTMTHLQMGEVLNRTEQAVRAKCFDLDLYKKELPWEQWEIDFLKKNYMEMSKNEITKHLNRTYCAVQLMAKKQGIKKYPYTCDYHYFDNIDTEEKAYWLGFLSADGWISRREETNSCVTGIELQYSDIEHLKKFNKSVKGNYLITDRWRSCSISTKDKNKKNHMCVLRIYSIAMYNALRKLGFTNNKSFDCFIPNIDINLMRHYIRGYFDGNGVFTFTNQSFHIGFITASENLYKDLEKHLSFKNIHLTDYNYFSEYNTKIFRPTIYNIKECIQFLDYIYKDSTIYLDRKYNKYLKVKEHYDTYDCHTA